MSEQRVKELETRVKELEQDIIGSNTAMRIKVKQGARLETRVEELEDEVAAYERAALSPFNKQRIQELEGELAQWQQNYADQMRNPKQRQAYLSQLEKRKELRRPGDSRLYYDKATKTIKCDKEPGLSITPEDDEPCM